MPRPPKVAATRLKISAAVYELLELKGPRH